MSGMPVVVATDDDDDDDEDDDGDADSGGGSVGVSDTDNPEAEGARCGIGDGEEYKEADEGEEDERAEGEGIDGAVAEDGEEDGGIIALFVTEECCCPCFSDSAIARVLLNSWNKSSASFLMSIDSVTSLSMPRKGSRVPPLFDPELVSFPTRNMSLAALEETPPALRSWIRPLGLRATYWDLEKLGTAIITSEPVPIDTGKGVGLLLITAESRF